MPELGTSGSAGGPGPATAQVYSPDAPLVHRTLVHGDYWPGNLLWQRGRLTGVVDWEEPRLGDPSRDVATSFSLP